MKFNIVFAGPENVAHLRRDLMLLLKYALEDLGHEVILSILQFEPAMINIIISGYFMQPEHMQKLIDSKLQIIHLNSEIIANDMLNFNPEKVDFMGAYLPFLSYGLGVMETVIDNEPELTRYGLNHHFLRWAYHEKLEDVTHQKDKDLDFYMFGTMSQRRADIINDLYEKKHYGVVHHSCPYYVRNSYIGRAKVQLNIIQDEKYTHVNCYRTGFLNNNRTAILTEQENDPAGFLKYARICTRESLLDDLRDLISGDKWKKLADESYEAYKQIHITPLMEKAIDHFLGSNAQQKLVG